MIKITISILKIVIKGSPSIKAVFFVLCENRYIPRMLPNPPPKIADRKRVFSGILFLSFFERDLSFLKRINAAILTKNRYKIIQYIKLN